VCALVPPRNYVVNIASGAVRESYVDGVAPKQWY